MKKDRICLEKKKSILIIRESLEVTKILVEAENLFGIKHIILYKVVATMLSTKRTITRIYLRTLNRQLY